MYIPRMCSIAAKAFKMSCACNFTSQITELVCYESLHPEEVRFVPRSIVMHTRGKDEHLRRVRVSVGPRFVCAAAKVVEDAIACRIRIARLPRPLDKLVFETAHARVELCGG